MAKLIEKVKFVVCLPVTFPLFIGLLYWATETEAGRKWATETFGD